VRLPRHAQIKMNKDKLLEKIKTYGYTLEEKEKLISAVIYCLRDIPADVAASSLEENSAHVYAMCLGFALPREKHGK
jgi:hypothetical protein